VDSGADALIVSNHGGRQLDGAPSAITALPAIVDAVGHQIEVHMDSGIRSGQDVLKAWALGARGTYIGRAFLWGLGAAGEAGVAKALQIIHKELDLTMAFCGHTQIGTVDRAILRPGTFGRHEARPAPRLLHKDNARRLACPTPTPCTPPTPCWPACTAPSAARW
jgi:L-lactate dehydrogenase (cytochrome)